MASFEILIWLICIFILASGLLLNSIYFFRLFSKKDTIETVRKYYRLIAIFMLALSGCGYLDLAYAYYQRYLGHYGEDPLPHVATKGGTYFFLITTCLMLSFLVLTRTIEKYVKQSEKMILTKIMLICFLITLLAYVTPPDITDLLAPIIYGTYVPFTLIIMYWGIFYMRLGKMSEGILKRRAYFVGVGLGAIFIGISVDIVIRDIPIVIQTTGYIFPIAFVILGICGVVLLLRGFKKD